jgi:hypothetical protein
MDVLSASINDDKIAWYENDGSENFTAHTITAAADGAWSVYAVDVDGDSDMDVLSASINDDRIAWYENDGSENFTAHTITTAAAAEGAISVFAVDVDGDSDVDVVSGSWGDDRVTWYENDGNTLGSTLASHPTGDGAASEFGEIGCTGAWDCVNDQAGNAGTGPPATYDSADYLSGSNGARVMFSLDDGEAPAGATITQLLVHAQVYRGNGGGANVSLSYQRVTGATTPDLSPVDGAGFDLTTDCCTDIFTTWSGLSWTTDDLDNLEVGAIQNSGGSASNITQLYVFVSYDAPDVNASPNAPSSLGPTALVSGVCSADSTPALQFTQSDSDVSDTLAFQIQIDDTSDFSSAVVDYQSASLAQGATSFTVGQAAGSGAYTTGSAGQTLAVGSYYWRVRSYDGTDWGTWSTANSGAIAFDIAVTCPRTVGPVGASECGGVGCEYQSIQAAIDAASEGDTITLYRRAEDAANNECYDEHLTIGTANLTLQGASTTPADAACIAPASGGNIVTVTASGVTLQDMHISGKVNDGASGTNTKGNGGRASGHGVYVSGNDVDGVQLINCTIDFAAEDNVRFDGDQDADGDGYIEIKQCYLHHADTGRNIRIIDGGGSASDRHIIRNCLIHTGQGLLVSGAVDYVTIEKNVIKGWPYYGHLGGSYPELRSAGFGGGWRYYSNCIAGVWVSATAPADLVIQNNLILGARWGVRVNTAGTIRNNTIVNPFNASAYDFDGSISPTMVRDNTYGIMIADGFGGTIQNNVVAVTADNRATGEPGQASSPYYSPGITGYGIAFLNNAGTLGGGASISNNDAWGFVDTDGTTELNYGSGIIVGETNLSFDPGFATDTGDESNSGSGPCLADGNDAGDTRCYELYEDDFFLATSKSAGSCHASVHENAAGAPEYVDLSDGGVRDADTHDVSGLDDCSAVADAESSRAIDFGSGAVSSEPTGNGGVPNLGAFGGTTRASKSANLCIVGIDVGDGGVKAGSTSYSGPGIIQPREDGVTRVRVYFNRPLTASSSSFLIRDACDSMDLTAPTFDFSGTSTAPYVAELSWPDETFIDQAVRIHLLGDGVDRIVDNASAEALDGELSDLSNGTLPSGDGTAGGDAQFVVYSVVGDVDGDLVVEGQSGQDDYDAVTGYAGYPAGTCSACPQDLDGDGDIDGTDLAAVTASDATVVDAACTACEDIAFGPSGVFESAVVTGVSAAAMDSTHVVLAYADWGNSGHGTAIVGTVSGKTIAYGSAVVFNAAVSAPMAITPLDSSHVMIAYRDDGNSAHGAAIVGTVSGNSISFGSSSEFNAASTNNISVDALDATHAVIAYPGNSGFGTAVVATVSGTTITYGSAEVFESANTNTIAPTALDSSHVVIAYRDADNLNYGTAIVGSVSGDSLSFGSAAVFESDTVGYVSAAALDTTHAIVGYSDGANLGTAVVGTISGTAISFGTPVVFESAGTNHISVAAMDSLRVLVGYSNMDTAGTGTAVRGVVSGGDVLTFDTPGVFDSGDSIVISAAALDSMTAVLGYRADDNGSFGTAVVQSCLATSAETAVYCYDTYASAWETDPGNMTDCSLSNSAETSSDSQTQELTAHQLESGTGGSGDIVYVRVRYIAQVSNGPGNGDSNRATVTPEFGGVTAGDVHDPGAVFTGTAAWSEWIDITYDPNAPATWTWADVTNLDVDITSVVPGGKLHLYKVELQITYEP